MWGGQPSDIVHAEYSQGGPGLLPMGYFRTNWFTIKHHKYSSAPALSYATQPLDNDPYYEYDYFPVPTSWCHGLFQPDFWTSVVRVMGNRSTVMGPLTFGTRELHRKPEQGPRMIVNTGRLEDLALVVIDDSMTYKEKVAHMFENARRIRAKRILNALVKTQENEEQGMPPRSPSPVISNSGSSASNPYSEIYSAALSASPDPSSSSSEKDNNKKIQKNPTYPH